MTLKELSPEYWAAAHLLSQRLSQLRQALKTAPDPDTAWHIQRRIRELTPLLTQARRLAELTEHYYERGYYRDENYTL